MPSDQIKAAPLTHIRGCVFQPTAVGAKLKKAKIVSERHGITWTVTGRLGRVHASIRNVLLSGEYRQIEASDDSVAVLCDIYGVLRRLGYKRPSKSDKEWLIDRIDELRQVRLEEDDGRGVTITGIVKDHRYAKEPDDQGRLRYVVFFSPEYVRAVREGHAIRFSPAQARVLAKMPPVASAALEYMNTHKDGACYSLDTILDAVGVAGSKSKISKDRDKVRAAVSMHGDMFGLELSKDENSVRTVR